MKTNKDSVQARLKKMSVELNVTVNVLLATYFFDAFLFRLSKSTYTKNFIFKGGFYLSMLIGIQNRYTQDLDFKLSGQDLDEKNLKNLVKEIIAIPADDGITFDFSSISPIRECDLYGGFSVSIVGHLENIRQKVNIDVATGDPITPEAVTYKYKRLLEPDTIDFMAYNLETVLSEKLQTILARGLLNSRSKDFYDIFIILKLKSEEIDIQKLRLAFKETCSYRSTLFEKNDALKILAEIANNEQCNLRWKNYAKKNSFAKGIEFSEILDSCKKIIAQVL